MDKALPSQTIGSIIAAGARRWPDRPALIFPDRQLGFGELHASACQWAKALIALGVRPGDKVGLLLNTCPEFVEVFFGIALAGAVSVPVNARYRAQELSYLVANADLVALITTGQVADGLDFGERLSAALPGLTNSGNPRALNLAEAPRLRQIVTLGNEPGPGQLAANEVLALGSTIDDAALDARAAAVSAQDTAIILYTSGTTANPKGAMITHRGQVCNARNLGLRYEVSAADKVWSPLPIFHIAGILPMLMVMDVGGSYITMPHFDPGTALRLLEEHRATIGYPAFVTIMAGLLTHPDFTMTDLSHLRVMNVSLAMQPQWIKEAMLRALPNATHVGTYGLTESAGTVTTSALTDSLDQRTTRLGAVLEEWEVRIVDIETGVDCPPDAHGEIALRGPNLIKGYYKAPDKTAEAFRDGWFFTGDIGSVDPQGQLMFHGRSKDMLKVGGENVAAAEIEALVQSHPAVKLAQVVGIPDDRYAEVPACFVEFNEGLSASEAELIAYCEGKLARFKVPRHVRAVGEWPMSTSKIQKFKLRQQLIEELGLG